MATVDLIDFKLIQGVPVIKASQGQTELNLIIDTGASHCVLCKDVADKLNYKKVKNLYKVYGIDGSSLDAGAIKADIQIANYNFENLTFQNVEVPGIDRINKKYTDGFALHGLLGSNFLHYFHLILDYNRQVLQIEDSK